MRKGLISGGGNHDSAGFVKEGLGHNDSHVKISRQESFNP